MNARMVAGGLGAITLAMGILGLVSPDRAMAFVGFAPSTESNRIVALLEARAVYGGLFTMLGVITLWGAIDTMARRSTVLIAGLLWLGLFAGRVLGISIDGNPGFFGWASVLLEGAFGTALVWAGLVQPVRPA